MKKTRLDLICFCILVKLLFAYAALNENSRLYSYQDQIIKQNNVLDLKPTAKSTTSHKHKRHRVRHAHLNNIYYKHNHHTPTYLNNSFVLNNQKKSENQIMFKKKRCRYSDNEIEFHNQKNLNEKLDDLNKRKDKNDFTKQPKTRDQQDNESHNYNIDGYAIEPHIETQRIYVDIGKTINLTCLLNLKEVDWHFKDKNLTTTIISNGLQLQVFQPIYLPDNEGEEERQRQYQTDTVMYHLRQRDASIENRKKYTKLKYKVSSDLHFTHRLTLYVQGEQDEGSYQCIDSISESPVKKTIMVILKNNSRALTSGLPKKLYPFYFICIHVLSLLLLARHIFSNSNLM